MSLSGPSFLRYGSNMIREMREKLGREIDQLSHELNILLPQAIAQAVELGDLRENSEYKAALERQQFVQARLGQLHQRLNQLSQLAEHRGADRQGGPWLPCDRARSGHQRYRRLYGGAGRDDGYRRMATSRSPLRWAGPWEGRRLARKSVSGCPRPTRRLRITDLVTVHRPTMRGQDQAPGKESPKATASGNGISQELMVVGDRVLITPEDGDERTRVGLYLPATAIDSQQVQTGLIVATGPGTPVADLSSLDEEPWKVDTRETRTRGMQARVGDHAIFFRKAAVEITFEDKKYLVVPQAAILVLVRDDLPI